MISVVSKLTPVVILFFFSTLYTKSTQAESVRVAIVIDDIGYRYTDKDVLSLPGAITYAILPHTPYGKKIATIANEKKNDVMLHIPMEAENGKKLGPGGLTSTMNEAEILASLSDSLAEIPFAIGINNHMGSHLTQLNKPMTWTMNFLKQHHLLFLDSKTSPDSKAGSIAKLIGVPIRNRHVFLDNHLTDKYITQQFQSLVRYAKSQKTAIAIAHPHPETIQALKRLIPTLAKDNIELVPLSALYKTIENSATKVASNE
ncbi:divergent polysaccharide deacetylase family protein [Colwellia sp. 20A7]|uniref:divergent polysaccharide deacetylase family protein n=1 Tax=Colwellia sp. 20A7 TaxID=2689569 RepID=UPI00135C8FA3|nr:divergent polysaccharide deacetylase family protein [Colwellia sp. 20A7]